MISPTDDLLRQHQALRKWTVQCVACQGRGHLSELPEAAPDHPMTHLRRLLPEMALDARGLCAACVARGVSPSPELRSEETFHIRSRGYVKIVPATQLEGRDLRVGQAICIDGLVCLLTGIEMSRGPRQGVFGLLVRAQPPGRCPTWPACREQDPGTPGCAFPICCAEAP